MLRRLLLALAMVLVCGPALAAAPDWARFKADFISQDGRLIDHFQDQASHSEGQGFALLLAVAHDDQAGFDLIWRWTRDNLQTRKSDHLFTWKWGKQGGGAWGCLDVNNASDGDMAIAWALLLAGKKWSRPERREQAMKIIGDIRNNLVSEYQGRLLLLPAQQGFTKNDGLVLNTSYFIFPAMVAFAGQEQPEFWHRLHKDCIATAAQAVFTRLRLPADWVVFNGAGFSVNRGKSEAFGFDAIRLPLYLAWDGRLSSMPQLKEYIHFVDRLGYLPRQVNLAQGSLSLDEAPAGFYAVMARVAQDLGEKGLAGKFWSQAQRKLAEEAKDYYSRVLYLLAKLERAE